MSHLDGESLGSGSQAAVKGLREVDVIAEAQERAARRRTRRDNYAGPEAV